LRPAEQGVAKISGLFRVNEAEIAEILEKIRAELPTTEVLLVGKPQSGKSSIIRGVTGVSAEIIGQGFRPHTTHTQRYNYPTGDLPLLIFTDTVGLGEGTAETQEVIQELTGELQSNIKEMAADSAKILILTVKISDFATDSLQRIITQIRRRHPEVPCLLAVTCLHEVYPSEATNHPAYPPDYEDVNRAFTELQKRFAELYDRAVLIDFTLEEDGYTPVFYGRETFVETLAELLPEAESRLIHQLLNEAAGAQISHLYRDAGRRYIAPFAVMAGTLAAVPLPLATMPVLTALQVTLVSLLGQLYGQRLTPSQAGGLVSAIAGGFIAQAIGRELVKFVPGFGSVMAASWAAAYTWALGEGACVYFGDLMGGKKPDPQKIKTSMDQAFKAAQARFKDAVWSRQE
jgi:uncharacterized protein (DUF697 family)/predicted GTPase